MFINYATYREVAVAAFLQAERVGVGNTESTWNGIEQGPKLNGWHTIKLEVLSTKGLFLSIRNVNGRRQSKSCESS